MKLFGPLLFGSLIFNAAPVAADLLRPHEGEYILDTAWQHRANVSRRPDCSHLVHQIYSAAGFDYEYAPSRALYAGTSPFRAVSSPQPGDLIVWRGHVGLVVDPDERTFYSSQRTGLLIANYDSRYWKGRGKARFFRYNKSTFLSASRLKRKTVPRVIATRPPLRGRGSKIPRVVFNVLATGLKVSARTR